MNASSSRRSLGGLLFSPVAALCLLTGCSASGAPTATSHASARSKTSSGIATVTGSPGTNSSNPPANLDACTILTLNEAHKLISSVVADTNPYSSAQRLKFSPEACTYRDEQDSRKVIMFAYTTPQLLREHPSPLGSVQAIYAATLQATKLIPHTVGATISGLGSNAWAGSGPHPGTGVPSTLVVWLAGDTYCSLSVEGYSGDLASATGAAVAVAKDLANHVP